MEKAVKVIQNEVYFEEVKRLLEAGKQVKIPVKGRSMEPFLYNGDLVVLEAYRPSAVAVGDVVLGKFAGKYMLHRVQEIQDWGIRMMGDGNLQQIEEVPHTEVMAVAIEGYRGHKTLGLRSKKSLFLAGIWYRFRFLRRIFSIFKRF